MKARSQKLLEKLGADSSIDFTLKKSELKRLINILSESKEQCDQVIKCKLEELVTIFDMVGE